MLYIRLSFFVNLHPTESQPANSRKINGVELKTRTKKTQDAENMKAPHIVFLPAENNNTDTGLKPQPFLLKSISTRFILPLNRSLYRKYLFRI